MSFPPLYPPGMMNQQFQPNLFNPFGMQMPPSGMQMPPSGMRPPTSSNRRLHPSSVYDGSPRE
jgi:hypothetical protein